MWVGSLSAQTFERLVTTGGNPVCPVFAGGRVYFADDVDGYSNVWSCTPEGDDLTQHTHHRDFFVRHLSAHDHTLCYMKGAELFTFDTRTGVEQNLDVRIRPSGVELQRRFIDPLEHLQGLDLAPDGKHVLATVRGKAVHLNPWSGPVHPIGEIAGVRYRLAQWMSDSEHVVCVSDAGGEEAIELHDTHSGKLRYRVDVTPRRIKALFPNPHRASVAVCDVAGNVHLVEMPADDVKDATCTVSELATSDNGAVVDAAWSSDGKWFAYVVPVGWPLRGGQLVLLDSTNGQHRILATDELPVSSPVFDPDGRFLFVLAARTFNPVFSAVDFGASIPYATKLYAFTLDAEQVSPFDERYLDQLESEDDDEDNGEEDKGGGDKGGGDKSGGDNGEAAADAAQGDDGTGSGTSSAGEPAKDETDTDDDAVEIELEGLDLRIVECPDVPVGIYTHVQIAENKILYLSHPTLGLLDEPWPDHEDEDDGLPYLVSFDLKTQKLTTVMTGVHEFRVRGDKTLIHTTKGLHVLATGEEPCLRVEVTPVAEWQQMYLEAWRLQREHFWAENMADIDWVAIRERYRPLLEWVATRSELSDLIWEMQGELGTSHAYEFGGDYPERNHYAVGHLGADLSWDGTGWRVDRVLTGDPWRTDHGSPLVAPAVGVGVGDRIVAINGRSLSEIDSPGRRLVNEADVDVELTVQPAGGGEERRVSVHTLGSERVLRYREWVEGNRAYVRDKSQGALGYIHIPNMSGEGLSEFFRSFSSQAKHPGLVVDVRSNGGGFVSQIIIEHLRRRVIGYDRPRYGRVMTYPNDAVRGAIVALCDQFAGSDGDIFAHAFKRYEIGRLIGTRTWGGVIGIDVNELLADGTIVTQPEYSTYHDDVGWGVENYGVDPHEVVEPTPADLAAGRDPQLDRAIEVALEDLRANPVEEPRWPDVPTRRAP
jgi:tricorn protease